ncbi:hypothetical protein A2U01_0004053 [Trifolium medium]|uniref:Uncharacterized protein n=1 Tax=Trifolium medium TaxID=97028 RepID=A0A392M7Z4_9FABA|nr:hypothetical protein [Trifolium medium]
MRENALFLLRPRSSFNYSKVGTQRIPYYLLLMVTGICPTSIGHPLLLRSSAICPLQALPCLVLVGKGRAELWMLSPFLGE